MSSPAGGLPGWALIVAAVVVIGSATVTWAVGGSAGGGSSVTAGPSGAPGAVGETGPTGAPGADGEAGPEGPRGATGAAGSAGVPGATGATGPAGAPGPTGPTGPRGAGVLRVTSGSSVAAGTPVTTAPLALAAGDWLVVFTVVGEEVAPDAFGGVIQCRIIAGATGSDQYRYTVPDGTVQSPTIALTVQSDGTLEVSGECATNELLVLSSTLSATRATEVIE